MRNGLIIFLCILFQTGSAQTIGGSAAFSFIKLPATPLLSASGGVNISYQGNEVGLAANNPALFSPQMHEQLDVSFNAFPGGIRAYSTTAAYYNGELDATLGAHIYYVDYGSIPQTDAAGNVSGNFHPVDFVVQASASKKYLERWTYGWSLKLIHSLYQNYRSEALGLDVGILYADSSRLFSCSVLAKNMGFQLKTYAGETEDLPFDLELGITQRLSKAPFGFSVTAQHAHRFDILYEDASFNNANNLSGGHSFLDKLVSHLVVASHIFIGNNLEAIVGYNHLRRTELNMGTGNGLNGFSTGLRLHFASLQVMYARSSYQRNIAYNQIGLTVQFNKLFGLGEL
ncbi:MAG: type IX secretion system protein PorQ [Flavisolibacter sp.]